MTDYRPLYTHSYALVMGIDAYQHLPPLSAAVKGAQGLATALQERFRFDVTLLRDEEVTRGAVFDWLNRMSRDARPDDRVLIYFAGHGLTRGSGIHERGYLALTRSEPERWHTTLAMDDVIDEAGFIQAKHLLYLLDCCFGGLALQVRATVGAPRELDYYLTRPVRYAISAGGREVVDDSLAPDGEHSLFSYHLLGWLIGEHVRPPGGIWRARELGNYLERAVAQDRRSGHKPNHNYLPGSGDGDFIFDWRMGPRLATDVEAAVNARSQHIRRGAVDALFEIARSGDPDQVAYATEWLKRLAQEDPDEQVREAAQLLLSEMGVSVGGAPPPAAPVRPVEEPVPPAEPEYRVEEVPLAEEALPAAEPVYPVEEVLPVVEPIQTFEAAVPQARFEEPSPDDTHPLIPKVKTRRTPVVRRWWRVVFMLLSAVLIALFEFFTGGSYFYWELVDMYDHPISIVAGVLIAVIGLEHFVRGRWLRGIIFLVGALSVAYVGIFKTLGVDDLLGVLWIWDNRQVLFIPVVLLGLWALIDALREEAV